MLDSIFGAIDSFSGNKKSGDFDVLSNPKDLALKARTDLSLLDWDKNRAGGLETLSRLGSYLSQTQPLTQALADQERKNIGRYYSGDIARTLDMLRQKRKAATNAAAGQALDYATKDRNISQIMQEGGDSSYNKRLGLKQANDILIHNALDQSNQERQDFSWLEGVKSGMTGKRQGIVDSLVNRILLPDSISRSMAREDIGSLGALEDLILKNTFSGLSAKKSGLEKWGSALGQLESGASEGMGAAMNMYSGFGGQSLGGGGKSGGGGGSL